MIHTVNHTGLDEIVVKFPLFKSINTEKQNEQVYDEFNIEKAYKNIFLES
jgi:hypothetical protein